MCVFFPSPFRYFDQISQDTGKFCFGIDDTLKALEMGAVETLICWENLDIQRYVLKNHSTGEEKILHLSSEQEKGAKEINGSPAFNGNANRAEVHQSTHSLFQI